MKRVRLVLISTLVCLLFCSIAVGTAIMYLFSPVSSDQTTASFIVVKGDTLYSVAEKLTSQGYLRHPFGFRLLTKISSPNAVLQPGTYKLSHSLSPKEILTVLLSQTQDVWVTLKEGWRTEEVAEELAKKLLTNFDADEFIELAKPVEGKLFPDTYLLPKDMNASGVFALLTKTFEDRYAKASAQVTTPPWDKKATIIVASLVEREGRGERDTRMIAGIIKNRLEAGMPLQIDATLQYATGYDAVEQTWWAVPTRQDKETQSLYNTYRYPGLPPTPICNPGLVSIKAALEPMQSDFLFYLHDPQGRPHYAKTYEEHQKNIENYLR